MVAKRGRPKKIVRNPNGRPTDYRPEMCAQVQEWVEEGIVNHEIAARLGIAESTLYDWKNDHPEFKEAFTRAHNYRHQNVKNALYMRCIGYDYTETTREPATEKTADSDKPAKTKMVVTRKVKKHVAPDPTSIQFYLTNHLPDEYKNKSEIDNKISGSLGLRSDGMSETDKDNLIKKQANKLNKSEG